MAKIAPLNKETNQDAKRVLIDLARLLARQAARTYFADSGRANLSPATVQLETGENDV